MNFLFLINKSVGLCRYYSKSSVHRSKKNNWLDLVLEMPKDTTDHIARMQAHRQYKKVAKSKFPPSTVMLQVLGSGARGAPTGLYMFTDQSRYTVKIIYLIPILINYLFCSYLFNCGEGSQRLAHEHKLKLGKVEHVFFTSSSWKNVGGLPGVTLTLQDVGCANLHLHGPPRLV